MSTPTGQIASIAELLRRVDITCKARYHAARRLSSHGWFSQWTLALLAVGQIVISLVTALGLHTNFKPAYVTFASVFFGVLVLAYSLLLGMANFSARAVKFHECGLQLGRLARKLVYLRDTGSLIQSEYDECAKVYYDTLEKHENHTRTDYLTAHHEYYDGKIDELEVFSRAWFIKRTHLLGVRLKIYLFHILQYIHYIASIILIYGWIYFMIHR